MVSPGGPTTVAVCGPWTVGHGVRAAGRNCVAAGKAVEAVVVARRAAIAVDVGIVARAVSDAQQNVFLLFLRLEVVLGHRELAAGEEAGANARPGNRMVGRLVLFHAQAGQLLPVILPRVAAGIVVDFEGTGSPQLEEARFPSSADPVTAS